MPDDARQRAAHQFFIDHFHSQEPFTKKELQDATGWADSALRTYWSKQFVPFVIDCGRGRFLVTDRFRPLIRWEQFQKHVTQVREAPSDYSWLVHRNVLIFDFFMPLANEAQLRDALDALFYKDTVLRRLRSLDRPMLKQRIPDQAGEGDEQYLERVSEWICDKLSGYSISHVEGRFRGSALRTITEGAKMVEQGTRYLIDETTAVVRFILRCGPPHITPAPLKAEDFASYDKQGTVSDKDAEREADTIRWLFGVLFVQSIVQVVSGQAEIWMVESGMRNRLHIWKTEDQ